MSRSWRSLGERRLALLLLALAFGLTHGPGALPAWADPNGGKPRLRNRVPGSAGVAVSRALQAARRRLADPGCAQLLTEFHSDRLRRPLTGVLELMGRTAGEHLEALAFEDGTRNVACAPPSVLAFTHVGGDTIYVCAGKFRNAVQNDPPMPRCSSSTRCCTPWASARIPRPAPRSRPG